MEKLAVITLDTSLNFILRKANSGTSLLSIAFHIADLVETEYNILKIKGLKKRFPLIPPLTMAQKKFVESPAKNSRIIRMINKRLRKMANESEWSKLDKIKLGVALLKLLIESTKTEQGMPVFEYANDLILANKRLAWIRLNSEVYINLENADFQKIDPRFLPMLVPPKKWDSNAFFGSYFYHKAALMKVFNTAQSDLIRQSEIVSVTEGLDFLGSVPWTIDKQIFDLMMETFKKGEVLGEIPSGKKLPLPSKKSCYRPASKVRLVEVSKKKSAISTPISVEEVRDESSIVEDDLNALDMMHTNTVLSPSYSSTSSLEKGESEELVFDEYYYREMCKRVQKRNNEMHSIRCDLQIKLGIAEKFLNDVIYFPHQLDFRGRAYPIPPNLSHLGSDLSRGLLRFSKAKPLGEKGLMWLKVHLANLHGYNKVSLEDRALWVDDHMQQVRDSARDPKGGERWWATAEGPVRIS